MLKLAPILKEVPEDIGMGGHEGSGSHDRQLHQALPFPGGGRIGPESIILKSEMANHNRGVTNIFPRVDLNHFPLIDAILLTAIWLTLANVLNWAVVAQQ